MNSIYSLILVNWKDENKRERRSGAQMTMQSHTNRGKWSEEGVPRRGWTCVGIEDLEEPAQICEMCESVEIRYVHLMQHSDYPESLGVGCICAEHMEQDYVNPSKREQKLRNKSQRRRSWKQRKWRVSKKGNPYLNAEGFNLAIFRRRDGNLIFWSLRVLQRNTDRTQYGTRRYPTEDAAKMAALDALIWAKEKWA